MSIRCIPLRSILAICHFFSQFFFFFTSSSSLSNNRQSFRGYLQYETEICMHANLPLFFILLPFNSCSSRGEEEDFLCVVPSRFSSRFWTDRQTAQTVFDRQSIARLSLRPRSCACRIDVPSSICVGGEGGLVQVHYTTLGVTKTLFFLPVRCIDPCTLVST